MGISQKVICLRALLGWNDYMCKTKMVYEGLLMKFVIFINSLHHLMQYSKLMKLLFFLHTVNEQFSIAIKCTNTPEQWRSFALNQLQPTHNLEQQFGSATHSCNPPIVFMPAFVCTVIVYGWSTNQSALPIGFPIAMAATTASRANVVHILMKIDADSLQKYEDT